jgi:signal transduction histidine kinase
VPTHHERALLVAAIVLTIVMVAMSLSASERANARPLDVGAAGLLLIAYGSLALRNRRPLLGLLVADAATSIWFLREYAGALTAPALLAALFFVTVRGDRRRSVIAFLIVIAPVVVAAIAPAEPDTVTSTAGIIGWIVAAALLGEAVAGRRQLATDFEEREQLLRAEQLAETQHRIAEERLRIARDMHDVLAHSVTAMSIQSAVASDALESDPDEARRALENLRRQARRTVDDVRASIGSLRADDSGAVEAVPGLAAVDDLVADASGQGLRVSITADEPPVAIAQLVDIAAYRIVQEALTNITRHSTSDEAHVAIRHDNAWVSIDIVDPGPPRCNTIDGRITGHGLQGMRERAASVGGSLDAGATDDGGFRVQALLPVAVA